MHAKHHSTSLFCYTVNHASLQTDPTAFDSFIYLVQNENTGMHVLTYGIYLIT